MAARLRVVYGGDADRTYELMGREVRIGRKDTCDIAIRSPSVSSDHARVFARDGAYFVVDCGSRNHTRLNGKLLAERVPTPLADRDRIGICGVVFEFRTSTPAVCGKETRDFLGSGTCQSVTQWIAGLKAGNAAAADQLWQRYFDRLVRLARKKLGSAPRRMADEEDVAANVFRNLWQGAEEGRFPELRDRGNLWPLLVVLTTRRARDLVRDEGRRGGEGGSDELENVIEQEPSPDFAAMMAENVSRLFSMLTPELREIAERKLEGHENAQIALALGYGLRTIERRLQQIRRIWDTDP
ncbi:MAG: ECF-type sigma factor [Thermoguttaceae bacterium]